ncbi:hypothetical protein KIPB_010610 [Kipferlia bialata]|uniref:Uncharacterized protein n=1 Tax=Kipferlia bialata TaxID=797122 RepID=A0A391NPX7_9EUKA|nr:hypothetical protein KIPB_010610 [Kipferlia bialata]|eukprot:g10610.t1
MPPVSDDSPLVLPPPQPLPPETDTTEHDTSLSCPRISQKKSVLHVISERAKILGKPFLDEIEAFIESMPPLAIAPDPQTMNARSGRRSNGTTQRGRSQRMRQTKHK